MLAGLSWFTKVRVRVILHDLLSLSTCLPNENDLACLITNVSGLFGPNGQVAWVG